MADFTVGAITGDIVSDGGWDYPLDFVFPERPEAQLQEELAGRLNADGTLPLGYNCLLARTPTRRVLIDTGEGGGGDADGRLLANLAKAGETPADIDVVLLTHAHVDHIGGLLDDSGELVFPGARHVMARVEWEAWTDEESLSRFLPFLADVARRVLPKLAAAGVLDLVEADSEVVPGVQLLPAPGHTPGHAAVAIRDGGEEVLLLADAVLDEMSLRHPEWTSVPDTDPEQTVATRLALLDRAIADGVPVLGYHFPGVRTVERTADGFRFAR